MARKKKIRNQREKLIFDTNQRNRNNKNQTQRRKHLKPYKKKKKPQSLKKRVQKYRNKTKSLFNEHENIIMEHTLGKMNIQCKHCGAYHFSAEIIFNKPNSFNDCCSHGNVPIPDFSNFPSELRSLFENKHELSKDFLTNIRSYNTSLSFASFNANLINFNGRRPGPYCFKVKGSIYYQINTALFPNNANAESFAQLFILDPAEANDHRINHFQNLNCKLQKILDKIMRKHNIFVKSYKMMKEEIDHLEKKCKKQGKMIPEVKMCFIPKRGINLRRYNPQRCNEVAAIFTTTADGDIPDTYVTIRNSHTEKLEYISTMDPKVEPWIYPLFHPRGNLGWERDLVQLHTTRRITRNAYIKNLIAIRDSFNPFLRGGRLFQQWLVDNYIKIEKDRTEYCKSHQEQLKKTSYQGIMDFLDHKAKENNCTIGKTFILPSTFIGSPRNMAQNYQDAMAIVRKYGKPDLFITMTCNPHWIEIQEQLLPNQQPSDRPDIVARVFHLKKEALLTLITKKHIFGKIQAWVYVIEFQKRDLPHLHALIILKNNYKITSPEIVNKFVCAEIPDPDEQPQLFKIVMKNMIHGPCGDWCIINGKCSKHFPKKFQPSTIMDKNGYPTYRRRDNEKYHNRPNGYVVDNRFVVPYSPLLLRKFNCHCNVEIVSSIKSVKYLFKYIYKGHDAATLDLQGTATNINEITYDEINEHIEARYVGPVEASWRILSKKLQGRSHPIIRLPIHLPNKQNFTIDPDTDLLSLEHILEQKNMLIDYFLLNKRDKDARKYLYVEIPSYYTFHKTKINDHYVGSWKRRQACFTTIARIYAVNPA